VFEVTVVAAPVAPVDVPVEEPEPASLWSTLITTVLVVGLLASGAAFYLI